MSMRMPYSSSSGHNALACVSIHEHSGLRKDAQVSGHRYCPKYPSLKHSWPRHKTLPRHLKWQSCPE
eukprot:5349868-Amphidinium_carterae.2